MRVERFFRFFKRLGRDCKKFLLRVRVDRDTSEKSSGGRDVRWLLSRRRIFKWIKREIPSGMNSKVL
jgi:hypothetical protein